MKKKIALTIAILLTGFMIVTVYAAPYESTGNPKSGNAAKHQPKQKEKFSKNYHESYYARRNKFRQEQAAMKKKRQETINNRKASETTKNRR